MKKTLLLLLITIYGYGQTGILTKYDRLGTKTPQELSINTRVVTQNATTGEYGYSLKTDFTDILTYSTASALPVTGVVGKLYFTSDDGKYYKWSGASYSEFGTGGSGSVPDATTTVKGKIKLAGDLGGTADSPTVPNLANKVDKVTGKSLIDDAEITRLASVTNFDNSTNVTALAGKVDKITPITGATKTKITYNSQGQVTSGADATTADIADSTNKRYVTDANLTTIGNQSGTNTGDNATNSQYSGLATSKQDALGFTPYNATNPNGYTSNTGTVTSVAALTIGTTGTAITSTVATGTTTPVITLNIPSASATARGALTTTDWSTFNGKASLASPTFTGTPTLPTGTIATTQTPLDSTTKIATTAFVTTADNLKANIASPTFTGTVSGITPTMVGLGSVNNTSDASKPVSTATQTALDLKQNTLSLTTTGSGASTLVGSTLNIPTPSSTATNLTVTQNATGFTINSDTGTDAGVPLGNGTNAGASLNDYTTAEKTKLSGLDDNNLVHKTGSETITGKKIIAVNSAGFPLSVANEVSNGNGIAVGVAGDIGVLVSAGGSSSKGVQSTGAMYGVYAVGDDASEGRGVQGMGHIGVSSVGTGTTGIGSTNNGTFLGTTISSPRRGLNITSPGCGLDIFTTNSNSPAIRVGSPTGSKVGGRGMVVHSVGTGVDITTNQTGIKIASPRDGIDILTTGRKLGSGLHVQANVGMGLDINASTNIGIKSSGTIGVQGSGNIGLQGIGAGTGVVATSGNVGVYSNGGTIGVNAISQGTGVQAAGTNYGLYANGGIGARTIGSTSGLSADGNTQGVLSTSYAGTAIKADMTQYTANGVVINSLTSSTGDPFRIVKNNVDKLVINQAGEIQANKFIKYGGSGTNVLLDNGDTTPLSTIDRPYKVYTALFTQTGTTAPTVVVLENTLGTITFSYSSVGTYTVSSSGLFTTNKTFVSIGTGVNGVYTNGINLAGASLFFILTSGVSSGTSAPCNSGNNNTAFEIRVYN